MINYDDWWWWRFDDDDDEHGGREGPEVRCVFEEMEAMSSTCALQERAEGVQTKFMDIEDELKR